MAVSFTVSVKPHLVMLRFDYNDARKIVLVARPRSQNAIGIKE